MKKIILKGIGLLSIIALLVINVNVSQVKEGKSLKLMNLLALNSANAASGSSGTKTYSGYTDWYPCETIFYCSTKRIVHAPATCDDRPLEKWSGYAYCTY
jgi:hypothetical protein